MLPRHVAWTPVQTHCPSFVDAYTRFLCGNAYTSHIVSLARLRPAQLYVAQHALSSSRTQTHSNSKNEDSSRIRCDAVQAHVHSTATALMAFPLSLCDAACDTSSQHDVPTTTAAAAGASPSTRTASVGYITALFDCCTSLHVMQCLLPRELLHVSVQLQTHLRRPPHADEPLLLVSRIDKLGKRLAYCTAHLLVDDDSSSNKSDDDYALATLHATLARRECVAHCTHIKSIQPR